MIIKVLRAGDEATLGSVGPDVFDHPLDPRSTEEFLADPRHHLVVAMDEGIVVGFASAVHYIHPDKPSPELWINEVGVASTHRGRGVGKAILQSMLNVGRELGCVEAWVLTQRGNAAAMRLYASIGGILGTSDDVMFTFAIRGSGP